MERKLVLILHDIRSAHNVGSMFRTADGTGVSRIFLSGYTQAPAEQGRRMLREGEKALAKTALGAEYTMSWEQVDSLIPLLTRLRAEGYTIVSLEVDAGGTDIREFRPTGDTALIVGHETDGVASEILATSDAIVEIPMAGAKESFNVSVAAGIALFLLGRVQ